MAIGNKFQRNLNQHVKISIVVEDNVHENVARKFVPILFRPQCVNLCTEELCAFQCANITMERYFQVRVKVSSDDGVQKIVIITIC